ncbi:MAG: LPS export ABC transporter periplasmic protein LptC [Magnetococcales bacterium]|nr:LPS export ABC transporter periplasmic protein LptC [Magnetococcales bacterium]
MIRLFYTKIMVHHDGVRTRWSLKAPSAERKDHDVTLVHKPKLILYREDMSQLSVHAHKGIVNNLTKQMVFSEGVVIEADMGRLKTERIWFDPETRLLFTDSSFELTSERVELEGNGLNISQEARSLKVLDRVKVVFPGGLSDIT